MFAVCSAVDELISSVPYLAAKTLETHLLLLSPVFGREAPLGLAASSMRISRYASSIATGSGGVGAEDIDRNRKVKLYYHVNFTVSFSVSFVYFMLSPVPFFYIMLSPFSSLSSVSSLSFFVSLSLSFVSYYLIN